MVRNALNKASKVGSSPYYWAALIVLALLLESIALIYQHALDYRPCVICIHVRIWTLGLLVIPALTLGLCRTANQYVVAHAASTAVMAVLVERSYQLLGTERGWTFGSCDFDLGLPEWLAIEEWFPWFFKVWEPCGQTPILLFGVTMAEALIALFSVLTLLSLSLMIATFLNRNARQ